MNIGGWWCFQYRWILEMLGRISVYQLHTYSCVTNWYTFSKRHPPPIFIVRILCIGKTVFLCLKKKKQVYVKINYWTFYWLSTILKPLFTIFMYVTPHTFYVLHKNFYTLFTTQFLYDFHGLFKILFSILLPYHASSRGRDLTPVCSTRYLLNVSRKKGLTMAYIKLQLVA
jgi:hypothetical protein